MLTRLMVSLLCVGLLANWAEAGGIVSRGGSQVYRGKWHSQSTGHSGPMRARVTARADGGYSARFTGRFFVIIPFTYRTDLTPVGSGPAGQSLVVHKQLGPLLGSYDMSAQLNPASFTGTFRAAGDTGTVSLRRVR
ncbi:MAG: hypothetical protein IT423_20210 [Pirellulaceae bacterium]|nr:hypothetical protein [Pirellulaceae bacterium]